VVDSGDSDGELSEPQPDPIHTKVLEEDGAAAILNVDHDEEVSSFSIIRETRA
jgi:hypothetical protein